MNVGRLEMDRKLKLNRAEGQERDRNLLSAHLSMSVTGRPGRETLEEYVSQ